MRHYSCLIGTKLVVGGREMESPDRIGVFVRRLFRSYFGTAPNRFLWHIDGFFAEAEDRQGNFVQVEQRNRDMRPIALLPARCGGGYE